MNGFKKWWPWGKSGRWKKLIPSLPSPVLRLMSSPTRNIYINNISFLWLFLSLNFLNSYIDQALFERLEWAVYPLLAYWIILCNKSHMFMVIPASLPSRSLFPSYRKPQKKMKWNPGSVDFIGSIWNEKVKELANLRIWVIEDPEENS
jgi:hypothetical protein